MAEKVLRNYTIVNPVTDLASLKAVIVSSFFTLKNIIIMSDIGLFAYDATSTATPDDINVVKPDEIILPAPGRWVLATNTDHAELSNLSYLVSGHRDTFQRKALVLGYHPGINDDALNGYDIGQIVIDSADDTIWISIDSTTGAARWSQIQKVYAFVPSKSFSPVAGSVSLILDTEPSLPMEGWLEYRGQDLNYGVDYTITGTTINLNFTTLAGDTFVYKYNQGQSSELYSPKNVDSYFTDPNGTYQGTTRVRQIVATGSHEGDIRIPKDFLAWGASGGIYLEGYVLTGADGAAKNIDFTIQGGPVNEAYNYYLYVDTSSTYNFTGQLNKLTKIMDVKNILPNPDAGGVYGIHIDHNGIGGSLNYIPNVNITYNT